MTIVFDYMIMNYCFIFYIFVLIIENGWIFLLDVEQNIQEQ